MFSAPNELNELPEYHFEFPFILIGISIMAFSTGQSWRVLKSSWGPEQGFRPCFADGLILVFYNISFSWFLPQGGFQFIFLLRDSENNL